MNYLARMSSAPAMQSLFDGAAPLYAATVEELSAPLLELEQRLRQAEGAAPLGELCAELFRAGGKRIRPLAALVSSRALGLEPGPTLALAEVAELTHGAALLHDDVIDEADTRRGQEAARRRWNNTLSILGGDHLLVRSFRLLVGLDAPALLNFYLGTLEDLLASEALQHSSRRDGAIDVPGYLAVAEGKTGSLFGFACAAPALLRGDSDGAARLDRFGRDLGITFQIADDLRDVLALDPSKPAALDLFDGVANLPLRCAAALDDQVADFLAAAQKRRPELAEVEQTVARVRATTAMTDAVAIGREHLQRSRAALNALPDPARFAAHEGVTAWLDDELGRLS